MRMFNPSAIRSSKKRGLDAMKSKNLLGNRLVLRHEDGMRARARIAQPQQIDVSDHVHFLRVVAVKRLSEIEDEVSIATRKRVQRLRTPIQFKIRRLMPQLLKGLEDLLAVGLFLFSFLDLLMRLASHFQLFLSGRSRRILIP